MTATMSSHDFNAFAGLFPTQGTLHSRLNNPARWTTLNKNTPFIVPRVPSQLYFSFQAIMFPLKLLSTISLSFSAGADLYYLAKKMLRHRFSQPHIPVPTNISIYRLSWTMSPWPFLPSLILFSFLSLYHLSFLSHFFFSKESEKKCFLFFLTFFLVLFYTFAINSLLSLKNFLNFLFSVN